VDYILIEEADWFIVRRDTGEVVVNRSLMSLSHNQQMQLLIEARDRGLLTYQSLQRLFFTSYYVFFLVFRRFI